MDMGVDGKISDDEHCVHSDSDISHSNQDIPRYNANILLISEAVVDDTLQHGSMALSFCIKPCIRRIVRRGIVAQKTSIRKHKRNDRKRINDVFCVADIDGVVHAFRRRTLSLGMDRGERAYPAHEFILGRGPYRSRDTRIE